LGPIRPLFAKKVYKHKCVNRMVMLEALPNNVRQNIMRPGTCSLRSQLASPKPPDDIHYTLGEAEPGPSSIPYLAPFI
jgi:hypothetical protein